MKNSNKKYSKKANDFLQRLKNGGESQGFRKFQVGGPQAPIQNPFGQQDMTAFLQSQMDSMYGSQLSDNTTLQNIDQSILQTPQVQMVSLQPATVSTVNPPPMPVTPMANTAGKFAKSLPVIGGIAAIGLGAKELKEGIQAKRRANRRQKDYQADLKERMDDIAMGEYVNTPYNAKFGGVMNYFQNAGEKEGEPLQLGQTTRTFQVTDSGSQRQLNSQEIKAIQAKKDQQVLAERKARLEKSKQAKGKPISAQQIADESGAIGDKFRMFPEDAASFVDDYINPGVWLGNMASGLGRVPLNLQEGNYGQAAVDIGMPLLVGRLAGIGAKNTGQFVNNLVNPVAGIGTASSVDNLIDLWRIQERGARPLSELAAEGKLGKMFQNERAINSFKDREQHFGQWFTKDKNDFEFYKADREFKDPEILHLRVPESQLGNYTNYNKSLSRAPEREFVIPFEDQNKFIQTSKSEIDWGKWNKEIPENKALMQEYNAIEQQAKATGTWMKNPDGSPFKGTPEQFVQQNSANFKKAYPEGFDNTYRGTSRFYNTNLLNEPLFTGDISNASHYTATNSPGFWNVNKNKIGDMTNFTETSLQSPEHLSLVKEASKSGDWTKVREYEFNQINSSNSGGIHNFYVPKSKNKIVIDAQGKEWTNIPYDGKEMPTDFVAEDLFNKNLDYIDINNVRDPRIGNIKIINPNKINVKSAIGNNGMFDMTNPNIYKALAPAITAQLAMNENQKLKEGGEMIKRADGSYSRKGLWDNLRKNRGSGRKPTKEMLEQERKIRREEKQMGGMVDSNLMFDFSQPQYMEEMQMLEGGGYKVERSNDRKGKTHKVTGPDGSVKYFGDPNMKERGQSKYGEEAFYARHKKNLEKNPHFRAYARATWEKGGIYIKPENKGKFTAQAQARGMGVQEFANKVMANKEDYSPTTVKRANFAKNFGGRKKHEMGGMMEEMERMFQMGGKKAINSVLNANKDLNWVQRLYEKDTPSIQIPGQPYPSTHFLESSDGRVYPTVVQLPNGELKYLEGNDAYNYADSTKTYIQFPTDKEAQWFSKNYKKGKGVLKGFQMGGSLEGVGQMYDQQRDYNRMRQEQFANYYNQMNQQNQFAAKSQINSGIGNIVSGIGSTAKSLVGFQEGGEYDPRLDINSSEFDADMFKGNTGKMALDLSQGADENTQFQMLDEDYNQQTQEDSELLEFIFSEPESQEGYTGNPEVQANYSNLSSSSNVNMEFAAPEVAQSPYASFIQDIKTRESGSNYGAVNTSGGAKALYATGAYQFVPKYWWGPIKKFMGLPAEMGKDETMEAFKNDPAAQDRFMQHTIDTAYVPMYRRNKKLFDQYGIGEDGAMRLLHYRGPEILDRLRTGDFEIDASEAIYNNPSIESVAGVKLR